MLTNVFGKFVQKIKIKNRKELHRGFVIVCIATFIGIAAFAVRGYENMTPDWIVSISADIFGMCLCCIIYYRCIKNRIAGQEKNKEVCHRGTLLFL